MFQLKLFCVLILHKISTIISIQICNDIIPDNNWKWHDSLNYDC